MRELRNCDFCDADAIGAFEIVPPELEPTEAEQRRVVCCPDCKERLETLIEPLLARAGAAGKTETGNGADEATATRETDGGGSAAATAESAGNRSPTAGRNAGAANAADGSAAENAASPGPDSEAAAESVLEEGITFEGDEQPNDPPAAPEAESDATSATDDGDGSEPTGTSTASPTDPATGSSNRAPKEYKKVVRLLRNREFPMERSAVEGLAAGAYDLESHEVEAIVDHAIEDGEFVEKNGQLRRP
jgi:hypothetical protein